MKKKIKKVDNLIKIIVSAKLWGSDFKNEIFN